MPKALVALIIALFAIPCSVSAELTLQWEMPADTSNIEGTKVYWGSDPDNISKSHKVPLSEGSQLNLYGLGIPSGTVYFEATTYNDTKGLESGRSETFVYDNSVLESGWTSVEADYYLGDDAELDYDGDGIINKNDPDIDGDGLTNREEINSYGYGWETADTDLDGNINVFDNDSDGDGILDGNDSHPLLDPRYGYVDHLYIVESGYPIRVALTSFDVSKIPYCECINTVTGEQRNVEYGNGDYFAISAENRGNLDGENGVEVAVTLENKNTSETIVEIRDIQTEEVYTPPAHCDINIVEHQYFMDNGTRKLAILGFCEDTQRTVVRIINADTRAILQDINFLDSGEHPLNMGIYDDVDGDGSPDIAVAPIPANEPIEVVNINTNNQIIFE